jgi:hypothetical protein
MLFGVLEDLFSDAREKPAPFCSAFSESLSEQEEDYSTKIVMSLVSDRGTRTTKTNKQPLVGESNTVLRCPLTRTVQGDGWLSPYW